MVTILYNKSVLMLNNRTTECGEPVFCNTVCVRNIQKPVNKHNIVNSNIKILSIITGFIFSKLTQQFSRCITSAKINMITPGLLKALHGNVNFSQSFKYGFAFLNESRSSFLSITGCEDFTKQIYLFIEPVLIKTIKGIYCSNYFGDSDGRFSNNDT
jgi:hypothetical protein